jgi:tetratricopeptide (TPR) repeat protein
MVPDKSSIPDTALLKKSVDAFQKQIRIDISQSRNWLEFLDRAKAQHYLDLASEFRSTISGPKGEEASNQLEAHDKELGAALAWLIENHEIDEALSLSSVLWRFWVDKGHVAEGRKLITRLIDQPQAKPAPKAYGEVLFGAGMLAFRQNDNDEANRLFQKALAVSHENSDKPTTVRALTGLARAALRENNYAQVRARAEEARAIARAMNDEYAETRPLHMLAAAAKMEGDLKRARTLYEESLALARKIKDEGLVSTELDNLGSVSLHMGDLKRAKDLYRESADRVHKQQNMYMLPYVPLHFSMVALEEGKHDRAVKLLAAADKLFESSGISPDPDETVERENTISRLRQTVDQASFERLSSEGRRLSLDQTIRYALED